MASNKQVVKVWSQKNGQASQSASMSCNGTDLKSYDTVIARFINGLVLVIDGDALTTTTAKQVGLIWGNIVGQTSVRVPMIEDMNHIVNVLYLETQICHYEAKQAKATKYDYSGDILQAENDLNAYKMAFGLVD